MIDLSRGYVRIMQITIVVLTAALFWFAFIYYPKIVADLKVGRGGFAQEQIFKPVSASTNTFPIETETFVIEHSEGDSLYYVYAAGDNVAEFEFNRENAKLILKNTLSLEDLCGIDVIYISTKGVRAPDTYNDC